MRNRYANKGKTKFEAKLFVDGVELTDVFALVDDKKMESENVNISYPVTVTSDDAKEIVNVFSSLLSLALAMMEDEKVLQTKFQKGK